MARPAWIAPLYGYAVCLVAIVTFLINASSAVNAGFRKAYPLQERGYSTGASLTSLESFRATYHEAPQPALVRPGRGPGDSARADTLTTEQLREQYEALRSDHLQRVAYESTRDLVKSLLLMVLAAALFVTHWRWVRSRGSDG